MAPDDLDSVTLPLANSLTEHRAFDVMPKNAWPDASAPVLLEVSILRDMLVQTGWNADGSGVIWQRFKRVNSRDKWSPWGESSGHVDPNAPIYIASGATMSDGEQTGALPTWFPVPFTATAGTALEMDGDGNLVIANDTASYFRASMLVKHGWGSAVIVGYSLNGGDVIELGRTVIASNDPVKVEYQAQANLVLGAVLALFMSSNFEFSPFSWSGGELLVFTKG